VSGQDRPEAIVNDVVEFRAPFQTLYYCFENGFPPNMATATASDREDQR
jgi:hypothetical protein